MLRTRFAPSPTGFLHVGGLRTALYSYLLAKQNKGKFILRIEDTDRARFVEGGVENILKSLYWAGIVPDEGVVLSGANPPPLNPSSKGGDTVTTTTTSDRKIRDTTLSPPSEGERQRGRIAVVQKGKKGPYVQSERLEIYKKYAQELLNKGHAYYCFCSADRLKDLREHQEKNKLPTGYDGTCRNIDPAEAKARVEKGETHVVRLKMPKEGETVINDLIRGEVRFKNELVDDQVLMKTDGFPTYHLAVVVDDHLMEITHVVRAEEWISSTPKHIQLYKYFGWEIPQFAHLSLLLNPDKTKLSKRQGDVSVEDYIQKGYLPEAMVNFVAFLGWNPGTEKELFTLDELVKEFKIEKINKSGAVFNLEKLDWYNREYLKKMPVEELVERAMPWFEKKDMKDRRIASDKKWMEKVLSLERERVTTLAELPGAVKFVFELPDYDGGILVWKKSTAEEAVKALAELKDFLEKLAEKKWNKTDLEQSVIEWIKGQGYSNGSVLWPMRVALSGQQNSPGPFEIAEVLGKEETMRRLGVAIVKL